MARNLVNYNEWTPRFNQKNLNIYWWLLHSFEYCKEIFAGALKISSSKSAITVRDGVWFSKVAAQKSTSQENILKN